MMHRFDKEGKLQLRKCVGVLRESEYKAAWNVYLKDARGEPHHSIVQIAYSAVPSGDRKLMLELIRKYTLCHGFDLVEII
jgi:hypothetical protein